MFEKPLVAPPGQPLAAFVCPGHPSRTALYSFRGTRWLRPRGVTVYFRTNLVGTLFTVPPQGPWCWLMDRHLPGRSGYIMLARDDDVTFDILHSRFHKSGRYDAGRAWKTGPAARRAPGLETRVSARRDTRGVGTLTGWETRRLSRPAAR